MNFDLAACRETDPYTATTIKRLSDLLGYQVDVWDLFFPPPLDSNREEAVIFRQAAVAICRTCPLMFSCLERAIELRDWDGIHGGKSRPEKLALAAARRRTRGAA